MCTGTKSLEALFDPTLLWSFRYGMVPTVLVERVKAITVLKMAGRLIVNFCILDFFIV